MYLTLHLIYTTDVLNTLHGVNSACIKFHIIVSCYYLLVCVIIRTRKLLKQTNIIRFPVTAITYICQKKVKTRIGMTSSALPF